MTKEKLIVGLGNPGKDYEDTRHNLGFLVGGRLAQKLNSGFRRSSLINGLSVEGAFEQQRVCILLPLTYMNNSGVAVRKVVEKKSFAIEDILVICDDLNLDFGQLRIRSQGSGGGHNGISSIIERLETKEFARLRIGIGHPGLRCDIIQYVLGKFTKSEQKQLDQCIDEAVDCCLVWLKYGVNRAMDQHNRRDKNGKQ